MSSWGRNDQAVTANSVTTTESSNGAPIGTYAFVMGGLNPAGPNGSFGNTSSGSMAGVDVGLFNNTTPGAFVKGLAVGVFGVSATEMANNVNNNSKNRPAHAGWVLRRNGTGPVTSLVISTNAGPFVNGETITVSGGTTNASIALVTNATGNIVSGTIVNPGAGFTNTVSTTSAFDRTKFLSSITVGGTPTGYNNTDIINISTSNASLTTTVGTASISTNATGGFVTANVTLIKTGLYANTVVAANLAFVVANTSGSNSTGSGATFTGALANSTGGVVTVTTGGRSHRVMTETLVAMGSLGAQTASYGTPALVADATSDNTWYPGS